MGVPGAATVTRAELARRWSSLMAVALLVAVVTGAVLTAVIGAHRSATAVDRFRSWSMASDIEYQANGSDDGPQMLAAARGSAAVERAGLRHLVNVWPADGSADIAVMTDPEDVYGTTLDRPLPVEGRMPAADAPDEIVLNELAAEITGLRVGDHLRANTWSATDLDSLFAGNGFPGFNGPKLDLVVVGIARTADELSGTIRRTSPYAIGSPGFLAAHPGIGVWPPALVVRLRPGEPANVLDDAMSAVQLGQASADGPGGFHTAATTAGDVYLDAARKATDSLVIGLLLFAAAAAVAGGLALAQAVQRQLAGSVTSSSALAALGLTRREIARVRSRPVAVSAAAGVVAGAALAVATSPLLPIGLVRRAETEAGVWVDPALLAGGSIVIGAAVWSWAYLLASREVRRRPSTIGAHRAPLAARLASRAGGRPALATGLRMAGERGHGAGAVPVRSAFVGVVIAMTGLVGAGVVTSSYRALVTSPERWGIPWSTSPDYFGDLNADELLARLAADARVGAVAKYTSSTLVLDGDVVSGSALDVVKGDMRFTLVSGRLPGSPTEIALGAATLRRLGTHVGDTVAATPSGGGAEVVMTVVGSVVLPAAEEFAVGAGAVVTPQALESLGQGDATDTPVLRFPGGADVGAIEAGLAADYGLQFNIFTEPRPQGSVVSLADPRDISVFLAVFLVVLAAVGLLHALLVSARRRRHDLGILRALGLSGRQVQRAVLVQALTLAAAGIVVGMPLGVIVGRATWRALVAGTGAVGRPYWPWVVLAVAAPAALVTAALSGWWPSRRLRVLSPAEALRAE